MSSPNPPPHVDVTTDITAFDGQLHIRYDLVNRSSGDVVVTNNIVPTKGPNVVSIIAVRPPGRVQVAKRAFAKPADILEMTTAIISGAVVGPGQSVHEDLTVPLPLHQIAPYGEESDPDQISFPTSVTDVVFCIGVIRRSDLPTQATTGQVALRESSATTAVQHLFCSAPYLMPLITRPDRS
jgi:hypothetical protein